MPFLTQSASKIIRDSESRPNLFTLLMLSVCAVICAFVLAINEVGLFHVPTSIMRSSVAVALFLCLFPQLLLLRRELLHHQNTKFILCGDLVLLTLVLVTCLNFHAFLALPLPILVSTQYHSRRLCGLCVFGSCLCALVGPALGYSLGCWDTAFLQYLSELGSHTQGARYVIQAAGANSVAVPAGDISAILLYLGLPSCLVLLGFGYITFAACRVGEESLLYQLEIASLSEMDLLTGMLNRNSYEQKLNDPNNGFGPGTICLYVDVNGLHELNNTQGHAAGDKMLQSVATCLQTRFDPTLAYRTGGDEFVVFTVNRSEGDLLIKVAEIEAEISKDGYSVSCGMCLWTNQENISQVIKEAESKMYEAKRRYYSTVGDRRRR